MKQCEFCYLVCAADTDIIVAYCETLREVERYLGVSHAYAWQLAKNRAKTYCGLYVEKVLM